MARGLTDKQRAVLEAIQEYWSENGIPPSLADLAPALGIRRSTVHQHVLALKKKGYLDHVEGSGRSWRPTGEMPTRGSRRVPVVGRVAAGLPIMAQENVEDWITVDDAPASATLFALRVRGDSMINAGILDGDLVVVRQQDTADDGDIVVALVDDEEATVKTLRREAGEIALVAANPDYPPIRLRGGRVRVQGKVVGVRRTMTHRTG
jgi:repressor LexA